MLHFSQPTKLQKKQCEGCIFHYMAPHIECRFNKNSILQCDFLAFLPAGYHSKNTPNTSTERRVGTGCFSVKEDLAPFIHFVLFSSHRYLVFHSQSWGSLIFKQFLLVSSFSPSDQKKLYGDSWSVHK